jgi:hypothetical protein
MAKLPFIKFFPNDWTADSVSTCSLAAQGLWLRMMFLMHNGDRYGYLSTNGSPTPPEAVARRCGTTLDQYETLLAELFDAGVPSRVDETIFSRRMVNDESKRRKYSRLGKLGGNPSLNPPDKRSLTSDFCLLTSDFCPQNLKSEEFQKVWREWVDYRAGMRKPVTLDMAKVQIRQMSRMGPHRALRMIEHTISRGWQGLREPDSPPQQLRANAYAATKVNAERAAQSSREMSLAFRDAAVPQPEVQAVPKKDDGSAEKARQIRELSRG